MYGKVVVFHDSPYRNKVVGDLSSLYGRANSRWFTLPSRTMPLYPSQATRDHQGYLERFMSGYERFWLCLLSLSLIILRFIPVLQQVVPKGGPVFQNPW